MAISTNLYNTEILAEIQENLYQPTDLIMRSRDLSMNIRGEAGANKTVTIGQAGASPAVVKDTTTFPLEVETSSLTDITITAHDYAVKPQLVNNLEQKWAVPFQRESITKNIVASLRARLYEEFLQTIMPTASAEFVLRSTGASPSKAPNATATGTFKRFTISDLIAMKGKLDTDLIPKEGRVLAIPTDMYNEMLEISEVASFDYNRNQAVYENGRITRLLGFEIVELPNVGLYDSSAAGVLKAIGAAEATTDRYGAIGYHPDYVAHMHDGEKVLIEDGGTRYLGSTLINALAYFGSGLLREDGKGVVALAQGY